MPTPNPRVYIRIGHKWPGYTDHVLAYFIDSLESSSDLLLVWDLSTGEQFQAPRLTATQDHGSQYTRPANVRQRQDAAADVELMLGERVQVMRRLDMVRGE